MKKHEPLPHSTSVHFNSRGWWNTNTVPTSSSRMTRTGGVQGACVGTPSAVPGLGAACRAQPKAKWGSVAGPTATGNGSHPSHLANDETNLAWMRRLLGLLRFCGPPWLRGRRWTNEEDTGAQTQTVTQKIFEDFRACSPGFVRATAEVGAWRQQEICVMFLCPALLQHTKTLMSRSFDDLMTTPFGFSVLRYH